MRRGLSDSDRAWRTLLPTDVHVVTQEVRRGNEDLRGLSPHERAIAADWSPRRRAEFAAGRRSARRALQRLGVSTSSLLRGAGGEPIWPAQVVGSVCHTDRFATAAVAERACYITLGIDAEPDQPLPPGVLNLIAGLEERLWVRQMSAIRPDINWGTLVLSAKESVLKAWYPRQGTRLELTDMNIVAESSGGRLVVQLRRPLGVGDRELSTLSVPWITHDGILRTAVAVEGSAPDDAGPALREDRWMRPVGEPSSDPNSESCPGVGGREGSQVVFVGDG